MHAQCDPETRARLLPRSVCFWCDVPMWRRQRSRDHVKPRFVGGSDRSNNIVIACTVCNRDRGRVTGCFARQQVLVALTEGRAAGKRDCQVSAVRLLRQWRRFRFGHVAVADVQAAWRERELDKLGRSPTGEIKLLTADQITEQIERLTRELESPRRLD